MGWQETSVAFYKERTWLNNNYNTPNMERLELQSMKFTQAYACPLSSPTRISLMTGQNAARHKVTNWTLFKDQSPDRHSNNKEAIVSEWNVNGMSMQPGVNQTLYVQETLPSILKKTGYKTIHIGKAHWGAIGTLGENPSPWEEDSRFLDKYKQMGLTDFEAIYASMLESMDKSLGDLMQHVRRLGIEKNTIIIFMSDNGLPRQAKMSPPLRGHKITPYEGGIRVPMLVKIPNMTKPGSVCNAPVIIEDIYPPILFLASAEKFAENMENVDGRNLSPLFRGKKSMEKGRAFFWHYPHIYDVNPYSIIRKGDWKLIWHYADQRAELFNLKEDIGEKNNLTDKEPVKAQVLRKEPREYLKSVNASIPISKSTNDFFGLL